VLAALALTAALAQQTHARIGWALPRSSYREESSSTESPEESGQYTTGDWLGTGALLGAAAALGRWPDPSQCRWCDRNAAGQDTLNALDQSTRNAWIWSSENRGKANVISLGTEFAPLVFLIPQGDHRFDETAIPVLRAFAVSALVSDAIKLATARERPDVHFGTADPSTIGANKSFVSGHTSGVFSLVFALARVYADRNDPHTRWVWMAGLPLAAYTGYLRIAADKHYATDVLTGAAIGGAIGWTTPGLWKHEVGGAGAPEAALAVGAGTLTFRWSW